MPVSGPKSPEEQRGYANGYKAGRKGGDERADAATFLFGSLVDGMRAWGFSIDEILDMQLAGAKERLRPHP